MFIKKSKKKIWKELRENNLEDVQAIKDIEKILIKKRGYVFKMPKHGESVVLLLSGGADSVVLWDILISEYKLKVYPLFLIEKKGISRTLDNQYRSVKFFEKFYKNKYGKLLNPVLFASMNRSFSKEILKETLNNPKEIVKCLHNDGNINVQNYSVTTRLSCVASDYAELLRIKKNTEVETIFTGNLTNDGIIIRNQTLAALRSNMLNLCVVSNNYKRQFTSLFIEKEMGYFFDKNFVIKWAISRNIPLKNTWSCWKLDKLIPCGICTTCMYRKRVMAENDLKDVLYQDDVVNWLLTIKTKIYSLFVRRKK